MFLIGKASPPCKREPQLEGLPVILSIAERLGAVGKTQQCAVGVSS